MVHAINLLIIGVITFLYYRRDGVDAAIMMCIGCTLLVTAGAALPWWIVLPLYIWLSIVARACNPEPKTLD